MKKRLVRLALGLVAATFLLAPGLSFAQVNPCAAKNPCSVKNPCAAQNPCAVKSDKKAPKGTKDKAPQSGTQGQNPCAGNPCATKKH